LQILSAQAELFDDIAVSFDVTGLEVIEETPAAADKSEKPHSGMVILFVDLEVLGKFLDPLAQKSNLDLGRTCIRVVLFVIGNDLPLRFTAERHGKSSFQN
jgi:hypothetical protein